MSNFFAVLGLPETLTLEPETIEQSWQSLARSENEAELHQARLTLIDPVLRLEHWLSLHDIELDRGTSMDGDLMDLFTQIHPTLEQADSVIKRHRSASTAIAKALLANEAIEAQLSVQTCLGKIHAQKQSYINQFPSFGESASSNDFAEAAAALGPLKFLKKWEQQCQERLLELLSC